MEVTPVLLQARLYRALAVKRSSSTACLSTIVPGTSLSEEYVLSSSLLTSACGSAHLSGLATALYNPDSVLLGACLALMLERYAVEDKQTTATAGLPL